MDGVQTLSMAPGAFRHRKVEMYLWTKMIQDFVEGCRQTNHLHRRCLSSCDYVPLCACHRSARKTLEFLCMYPVRTKRSTRTRGGDRNFHSQESMNRTANALLHALVIVPKVESSYLRSKARDFQDHFLALGVRSAVFRARVSARIA